MRVLCVCLGGNWGNVERALPLSHSMRVDITTGKCEVSAVVAFRVARALDVPLTDAISGKAIPTDACRHCGKSSVE